MAERCALRTTLDYIVCADKIMIAFIYSFGQLDKKLTTHNLWCWTILILSLKFISRCFDKILVICPDARIDLALC